MTLFFSRRGYDGTKHRFTKNPSKDTYYLAPTNPKNVTKKDVISQKDWLAKVKAQAHSRDITIFVHGYNTAQSEMLARTAKIEAGLRRHGYRGAVIGFDWPSDGRGTLVSYARDRKDAKRTAASLVEDGILPLLTLAPRHRINLIAHSMGAYLTLRGFSGFNDASGPGASVWKTNQILFVSGDADQDWMSKGAWGALVLAHRSRRFTNYFSQLDDILNGAVVLNGGAKRVGRSGIKPLIHKNHVDIYSHEQYLKDVKLQDRTALNSHRWWFDNDKFYHDAALTLAGQDAQSMPTRRKMNTTDLALLS
ncbi:hypothetical protein So717_40830 [Roseobacter cerasinus]|uniref:Alpha/beta hydrolase n=1 Tax=Roseobacter cerasinus TaxID=2602289 RepID=A0A640VY80_9RHOB|nr:alpha/beta fold hydrolase [Roseobacter cerasinus]GFE52330.1 hypothetical protein So717_40830 [Roseobacter cerasinus]